MKLEITHKGANGPDGPLQVGDTVDIDGDVIPAWLVNKARPIGKVAVTNPAKGATPGPSAQERQDAMKAAALAMGTDDFNADGMPDVRALNAAAGGDVPDFTAAERDQLWPGIADAVKAERG